MACSRAALLAFVVALLRVMAQVSAEGCPRSFNVSSATLTKFVHCKKLTYLNGTLSWTYDKEKGSVDIAFRARPAAPEGWVAWGINPTATGMVGTQALIAFKQSNGTVFVGTYNVTSKRAALLPSNITISVTNLSAVYYHSQMMIFGTLLLPSTNKAVVNQVWQVGSQVEGLNPKIHAFETANLLSLNSIDLVRSKFVSDSGRAPTPSATPSPSPTSGAAGSSNTTSNASTLSITLSACNLATLFFSCIVLGSMH